MVVVVGLTLTATPVVTEILPGVITPEPPEKVAVRLEPVVDPASMVAGLAVKLVMAGAGSTDTCTVWVTAVPTAGVTVRV